MDKTAILKDISEKIFTEHFCPGEFLIERDLCATYGLSRTPMREILMSLAAKGLVTRQARKGFAVRTLDWKQLFEVFEAREGVEGMAARLCCQKLSPSGRARLCEMRNRLEALDAVRYSDEGVRLGRGLHKFIAREADNSLLRELYEKVDNMVILTSVMTRKSGSIEDGSRSGHLMIISAILKGDPDEAELRMREHIRGTCGRLVELLYPGRLEKVS